MKYIDSNGISEYVHTIQRIHRMLMDIDTRKENQKRLLDNLAEEQNERIYYYRKDKWRNREHATELDYSKWKSASSDL